MEATNNQPANTSVDFISMLSHELSTPLAGVRWHAELLRMGKMSTPLDASQIEMVDEIIEGAARMGELINDIHNCSWLEKDKFNDLNTPVVLADLLSTAKDQQKAGITTKNLTYTVDVSQPIPSVATSPSIVTIILQNLFSNAVKYTPAAGTVTVTLRPATAEEAARSAVKDQVCVLLSVADTGYGIPQAQQDQVFSKFFRADNVTALGIYGTGLGLYIVATAVAKLGGGVWFESEEGKGTTVSVVLPTKV